MIQKKLVGITIKTTIKATIKATTIKTTIKVRKRMIGSTGISLVIFWGMIFGVVCSSFGTEMVWAATMDDSESITDTAMGTDCSVRVFGAKGAAKDIIDMLSDIENRYLSWRIEGSDIANLNEKASEDKSVTPSEWTYDYLEKVLALANESNGAFDPTLGRLSQLWNLGTDEPYIPKKSEVTELLFETGWEKITLDNGKVYLKDGVQIDLGAAGKGIGCDEARILLEETDAEAAVVAVGGSILTYGDKPDGKPWKIGITNPRTEDGEAYLGSLTIEGTRSISTSGDYEKYVIEDGVRYHHILDPKTGYPAESGLISVTIVCEEGWLSDGLSTACFVLGYEDSLPLLETYQAEAVFVTEDKKVLVTDGLKDTFTLTDSSYEQVEE